MDTLMVAIYYRLLVPANRNQQSLPGSRLCILMHCHWQLPHTAQAGAAASPLLQ